MLVHTQQLLRRLRRLRLLRIQRLLRRFQCQRQCQRSFVLPQNGMLRNLPRYTSRNSCRWHTANEVGRRRAPTQRQVVLTLVPHGTLVATIVIRLLVMRANHTSLGRHRENSPPQGKVVELIGRSSVEWRGGAWNDRLNEICMRAVEEANITFDAAEVRVLTELQEHIAMVRTQYE